MMTKYTKRSPPMATYAVVDKDGNETTGLSLEESTNLWNELLEQGKAARCYPWPVQEYKAL